MKVRLSQSGADELRAVFCQAGDDGPEHRLRPGREEAVDVQKIKEPRRLSRDRFSVAENHVVEPVECGIVFTGHETVPDELGEILFYLRLHASISSLRFSLIVPSGLQPLMR